MLKADPNSNKDAQLLYNEIEKEFEKYHISKSKESSSMNHDQAIEALQAHKEGRPVQGRPINSDQGWTDIENPHWNFLICEFRAKPEPRTFFLNIYKDGEKFIHLSKEAAKGLSKGNEDLIKELAIELQEVIK